MTSRWLLSLVRNVSFAFAERQTFKHVKSIHGLNWVPHEGPIIVVPNHRSYFDHYVVSFALRLTRNSPTWFLTKKESFEKFFRRVWTEAWYGIPVDRLEMGKETFAAINKAIQEASAVCIYPEGTRNKTDVLLDFKDGAFRFAASTKTPIVPVFLKGTNDVLPIGKSQFSNMRASIIFGPPLIPPMEMSNRDSAEWLKVATLNWLQTQIENNVRQEISALDLVDYFHNRLDRIVRQNQKISMQHVLNQLSFLRKISRTTLSVSSKSEMYARLASVSFLLGPVQSRALSAIWMFFSMQYLRSNSQDSFWSNYLLGRWEAGKPFSRPASLKKSHIRLVRAIDLSPPGESRALVALVELLISSARENEIAPYLKRIVDQTDTEVWGEKRVTWARKLLAKYDSSQLDQWGQ